MPCSAKFSMTIQTEILSTKTSDFLKQIIFLMPFNSLLSMGGSWPSIKNIYEHFTSDAQIGGNDRQLEIFKRLHRIRISQHLIMANIMKLFKWPFLVKC